MKLLPGLEIAGCLLVVLGLTFGLYGWLTREQRRTMREIRDGATVRGWKYRLQRWQGNPTAFRIDGQTRGIDWRLTSGNTAGYDRGWSVQLRVRFPTLRGPADFAVLPRSAPRVQFPAEAQEMPSGLADFDAGYLVMASPERFDRPPVNAALAARLLTWPEGSVTPHSVLAWRDSGAMELQVRLPGPPNWATVAYAVEVAGELAYSDGLAAKTG